MHYIENIVRLNLYVHCKYKFYRNYFLVNINNSKKVWNGIKEIVDFKAKVNQKTTKIVQDNTELTDPKVVANAFNNYFANVGANLASLIPDVNKSPLEYLENLLCNNFYLFPVTPAEIETQISNLNFAKAAGPYSIPANILKILKSAISMPLRQPCLIPLYKLELFPPTLKLQM